MDFTAVDKRIAALEATRAKPCKVSPTEPLAVGLDLGTAYIVLAVVDSRQRPVACAVQSAQVVRDGLVVDYAGGLRMVRALREQLEDSLGRKLEKTAIAVPPAPANVTALPTGMWPRGPDWRSPPCWMNPRPPTMCWACATGPLWTSAAALPALPCCAAAK